MKVRVPVSEGVLLTVLDANVDALGDDTMTRIDRWSVPFAELGSIAYRTRLLTMMPTACRVTLNTRPVLP